MKEDYLWDKTGNDPEIEKLENVLKAFRQKETTPPAIPAKVIPVKSEPSRSIFPFAFAFAASITFVLILVGVWFQTESNTSPTENNLAKISPQKEIVSESSIKEQQTFDDQKIDLPVKNTVIPKEPIKRKAENNRRHFHKITYRKKSKIKPKNIQNGAETAELTKEEKYAYDQLMLALSITSSKLNLVKDKIRGEVREEIPLKVKEINRSN
jgi:hypothetical protein